MGSARWHTMGNPIVYLAESPAGAMLERIVHLWDDLEGELPRFYQLLQISGPDELAIKPLITITSADWKLRQDLTRELGDLWLSSRETPLALVPSPIVPHTSNYLLNPAHPDAIRIKIVSKSRERFDNRLFHFGAR